MDRKNVISPSHGKMQFFEKNIWNFEMNSKKIETLMRWSCVENFIELWPQKLVKSRYISLAGIGEGKEEEEVEEEKVGEKKDTHARSVFANFKKS